MRDCFSVDSGAEWRRIQPYPAQRQAGSGKKRSRRLYKRFSSNCYRL